MFRFVAGLCCVLLVSANAFAQKNKEIVLMDFVKIIDGKNQKPCSFMKTTGSYTEMRL